MEVLGFEEFANKVERLHRQTGDVLRSVGLVAGSELLREVQDNLRRKKYYGHIITNTGNLLKNTTMEMVRGQSGKVRVLILSNTNYAAALHDGARPHKAPYRAVLFWVRRKFGLRGQEAKATAMRVVKKIEKKGTRPRPYFNEATEEFDKRARKYMKAIKMRLKKL